MVAEDVLPNELPIGRIVMLSPTGTGRLVRPKNAPPATLPPPLVRTRPPPAPAFSTVVPGGARAVACSVYGAPPAGEPCWWPVLMTFTFDVPLATDVVTMLVFMALRLYVTGVIFWPTDTMPGGAVEPLLLPPPSGAPPINTASRVPTDTFVPIAGELYCCSSSVRLRRTFNPSAR